MIMKKNVYERLVSARKMLVSNPNNAQGHYLLSTVYWIEHHSSTNIEAYRK